MNTCVAAITPDDDRLRKAPWPDLRRSVPQAGDILACERSARADVFSINIIPTDSDVIVTRYAEAIERVQELARTRRVDGWYTCGSLPLRRPGTGHHVQYGARIGNGPRNRSRSRQPGRRSTTRGRSECARTLNTQR